MYIFIDIDNTILATNYILTTKYRDILPEDFDINKPVGFIDFKDEKLNDWYANDFLNNEIWEYVYQNVVDDIKAHNNYTLIVLTSRKYVNYPKLCQIFGRYNIQLLVDHPNEYKIKFLNKMNDDYIMYEDHNTVLNSNINKVAVLQPWNEQLIHTNNIEFIIPQLKLN